jgi:hypothetical protein
MRRLPSTPYSPVCTGLSRQGSGDAGSRIAKRQLSQVRCHPVRVRASTEGPGHGELRGGCSTATPRRFHRRGATLFSGGSFRVTQFVIATLRTTEVVDG